MAVGLRRVRGPRALTDKVNDGMTRVGISGHLCDAIWKARVLQSYPVQSVHLFITPGCRPLRAFFRAVKSVAKVDVDERVVYRPGDGEQSHWTVLLDLDTTYPGYPNEWVVNYVAACTRLPRIRREEWFGSFRYVLGRVRQRRGPALFISNIPPRDQVTEQFQKRFPSAPVLHWDKRRSFLENIRRAAACSHRLVPFDASMAMMCAVGLPCIVDRTTGPGGHYEDLFRSYGETIVSSSEVWPTLLRELERAPDAAHPPPAAPDHPRLALSIPTICCADLLEEAVDTLRPQLGAWDRIFVIDNGRQALAGRLRGEKISLSEEPRNLGVAGSWNKCLRAALKPASGEADGFDWVLMMNDDICLGPHQLAEIKAALAAAAQAGKWLVVGPHGWSVFALNRACLERVGFFDEAFFPAYFEDNDYYYRLRLVDPLRYWGGCAALDPPLKRNSVSISRRPELNASFQRNHAYYVCKWGGPPGDERHRVPFGRAAGKGRTGAVGSVANGARDKRRL